MRERPRFLITIDTEGDNLWSNPTAVTCANARYLPRFQQLCERHGLKPTYVTNLEMAGDPAYLEFARDGLARGTLEVGLHVHAWDTPPLTDLDRAGHAYLIEHPVEVMRAKIETVHRRLEDALAIAPRSHRAGRWAMDERYAALLLEFGYQVDCSVTPKLSWTTHPGATPGRCGCDYTHFPDRAYLTDPEDLSRSGDSGLLEVPLTVLAVPASRRWRPGKVRRALGRLVPAVADPFPTVTDDPYGDPADPQILRPTGRNLPNLLWILDQARRERRDYVEFMLHSSEFMPGGSPTFATPESIERLYEDLEVLFATAARHYQGATLSEYRDQFVRSHAA